MKGFWDLGFGLRLVNNAATVTVVSNYPGGDQAHNDHSPAEADIISGHWR